MENLFTTATKNKVRFLTSRGSIDVEQLWDMPLSSKDDFNLNVVAKTISRKIRADEEESFVTVKTTANDELTLMLDIVKFVIATKLDEAKEKASQSANKAKKELLLTALVSKENEAILAMTPEQIKEELAKLK